MQRRDFLTWTGACAASSLLSPWALAQDQRPNILWIIAEDFCPELACYGYPLVQTPHIDALAAQGVRFTHAFTTAPVCSASRSGFMTGVYQTTTGAHHHRSHRLQPFTLPGGIQILPHLAQQAGYFTANITKGIPGLSGTGKTDWNFAAPEPYQSKDWTDLKAHQPFFAQINFPETHRKFHRSKTNPTDASQVPLPPYLPDDPRVREDWAAYLDTVNALDEKVGKVLAQLEADGLAENTVVFFFGDHGRAHVRAKQWCYDDGLHIPLIIRWPGKFQPGTVSDTLVSTIDFAPAVLAITGSQAPKDYQGQNFLDPTLTPRAFTVSARDRCDETIECIRTVRDSRYRYIRNFMHHRPYMAFNEYKESSYPARAVLHEWAEEHRLTPAQQAWMEPTKPVEELYDLQTDPHSIHNLASLPEHKERLVAMRETLYTWMRETNDLGLFPEPELMALEEEHGSGYAYIRTPEGQEVMRRVFQTVLDGEAGHITALTQSLADPSPSVRYWAALGLGNAGSAAKRATPALEKALWDRAGSVRVNAALILCQWGIQSKAFHVLMKALRDANPGVRHYAALAFDTLGEDARPALPELKKARRDPYECVQRTAEHVVRKFEYAVPKWMKYWQVK
ncbi:MAG: sulfatase-like hydrolase/transferase [bacterium]|jgi:arylsulfatase A-like enzyme|nr:sulfatase-like hydrolase/transferase [bacterium]